MTNHCTGGNSKADLKLEHPPGQNVRDVLQRLTRRLRVAVRARLRTCPCSACVTLSDSFPSHMSATQHFGGTQELPPSPPAQYSSVDGLELAGLSNAALERGAPHSVRLPLGAPAFLGDTDAAAVSGGSLRV